MENYIVINGRMIEITPAQLKALGIGTKKKSPFARGDHTCYVVTSNGNIRQFGDWSYTNKVLSAYYAAGNYCTDRQMMIQRGYNETLNRLLWRYSMEHNGDEIVWGGNTRHYFVVYDPCNRTWGVRCSNDNIKDVGKTYFIDERTAHNAIKEIIEPFVASRPDFRLG